MGLHVSKVACFSLSSNPLISSLLLVAFVRFVSRLLHQRNDKHVLCRA